MKAQCCPTQLYHDREELLAVVMCLKELRPMLLRSDITIYTDHKNLKFCTLNPQYVLHWVALS